MPARGAWCVTVPGSDGIHDRDIFADWRRRCHRGLGEAATAPATTGCERRTPGLEFTFDPPRIRSAVG
ncbi:hypothetical protein CMZ82_15370 [Lysobacteraceae bacterium NML93-0792]|nr:hypothetical protein CMZ82_15370 [Xanthomonadaceae bacterium NML93-0792]PBS14501.1 hypothetical protein CMZ81_15670 [Xanthomonadaceae bacterium NML93-0793]PBS19506.1 hypothetical protein CMZ80_07435 [Xanthomonadaceae bacterium NML93-0831]